MAQLKLVHFSLIKGIGIYPQVNYCCKIELYKAMKIHQHISSIHACLISYGLAHILVDYIHINSNVCMPIAKPIWFYLLKAL